MNAANYIIISPVRNEERYLPLTLDSILKQTSPPQRWIIVNDGSTDDTGKLAAAAAARHPWIQVIQRADRGSRSAGTGVIQAFNEGFAAAANLPWDFLVKLDGDVSFQPDYFVRCLNYFRHDSRLGIGGGLVCNLVAGTPVEESKIDPTFHVRGATKIYRKACWLAIGGLIQAPGWDTVDEVKANMLGWSTRTFTDLRLIHHRQAGVAYGTWNNWVKGGKANYIAGYHPLFMSLKCLRRLCEKPYGIAACGLFYGYMTNYLRNAARVEDPAYLKYFHRQQMNRLLGRKSLWQA